MLSVTFDVHPAPMIYTYKQSGAQVLVTDEVGAVQFKVQPDSKMEMTTWLTRDPEEALAASQP